MMVCPCRCGANGANLDQPASTHLRLDADRHKASDFAIVQPHMQCVVDKLCKCAFSTFCLMIALPAMSSFELHVANNIGDIRAGMCPIATTYVIETE
eukprot:scaffold312275_cov20-Prasinocladus_malaysianus.AAC.1